MGIEVNSVLGRIGEICLKTIPCLGARTSFRSIERPETGQWLSHGAQYITSSVTFGEDVMKSLNFPTFTTELRFQLSEQGKQVPLPTKGHLSTNYIQGQERTGTGPE